MRVCMLNCFSCIQLFVTLWTIAILPGSTVLGFSRQEYWHGLPFHPPGDLSNPGIKPSLLCLLHWQVGSLPLVPSGKPTTYDIHLPNHVNLTPKLHPIPKGTSLIKLSNIAVVHIWRFSSSGKTLFRVGLYTKLTRMTLQNITHTHTHTHTHTYISATSFTVLVNIEKDLI